MGAPDDPTRRLPEARPGPPPPVAREREVIADDGVWRARLDDQLRTLRAALAGVGVIALAALALGIYLLTEEEDDDDGRAGASRTQVRALEERVDKLGSRLGNRAGEGDVDDVAQSQSELAGRVDVLEQELEQSAEEGDTAELEQTLTDLSGDLQELSQRVDELEQEQQQQP